MITELTKEQRDKIPEYAQSGIELGLRTGPYTAEEKNTIRKACCELYANQGRRQPLVLFASGPYSAIAMCNAVKKISSKVKIDSEIYGEISNKIRSEIDDEIDSEINGEISDEIYDEINSEIYRGIYDEINSEIDSEISDEINGEIYGEINSEIYRGIYDEINSEIDSEIYGEIRSEISGEISDKINSEINGEIDDEIDDEIRSEIYDEIDSEIYGEIYSEIYGEIYRGIGQRRKKHPLYVPYWAYWMCYHHYYISQQLIKLEEQLRKKYENLYTLVMTSGCIDAYTGLVVVWERPQHIKRNAKKQLHCDGGPALRFRDGFALYRLNGVKVPKDIACLHHSKIPVSRWIDEKNVEVKREIIRKIGIERIYNELGATVIDSEEYDFRKHSFLARLCDPKNKQKIAVYELIEMQLTPETKGRYLKMVNPSINTIHIEGVGNECQTVQDAIDFRKPEKLRKIPVSDTGADWHQQGDVCIWPRNAKAVKPRPAVLT